MLTTCNTRYLRLPMGICSASEVFHETVYQFLEDLNGVSVDMIVWGSKVTEHDEGVEKTLQRLTKVGLVLNVCYFRQPELPHFEEIVTQDGVKPGPEKVEAVTDTPTQINTTEQQRLVTYMYMYVWQRICIYIYICLVTHIGRYIPNLSATTAPLRSLLGTKRIAMACARIYTRKVPRDHIHVVKSILTKESGKHDRIRHTCVHSKILLTGL